MALFMEGGA